MGSGVLAGVDPQGAQGLEGQTQLALPLVVCFGRVPSSMGPLSTLGSRESILLVFWRFSGLFRQMWVESKWSTGHGEPSVLLCCHLPHHGLLNFFYSHKIVYSNCKILFIYIKSVSQTLKIITFWNPRCLVSKSPLVLKRTLVIT